MTKKLYAILIVTMLFTVTTIRASFPVQKSNGKNVATEQVTINKKNIDQKVPTEFKSLKNSVAQKLSKSKAGGGDNDLIILVVLWFFLGFVAAHRWYKGKPVGWNILFILTGGGCGIWAIVDLINILTGKF